MPKKGGKKSKKQTPEEMLRLVEMMNAAMGGRDLRHGKGNG